MPTAQQLIDRAKWQADVAPGTRFAASDLLPFLNLAYREAWDLLVSSGYEDHFETIHSPGSFTLAGGLSGNTYVISATDFFKVKGVQAMPSGGNRWSDPLPTYEFNESGSLPQGLSYRQSGLTLYFEPNESVASWTYRLWYISKPADLALGDSITDVNGWVEPWIIDTLVWRIGIREEDSDLAVPKALIDQLRARIVAMAANRNAGKPRSVARTRQGRWRQRRNRTRSGMWLP